MGAQPSHQVPRTNGPPLPGVEPHNVMIEDGLKSPMPPPGAAAGGPPGGLPFGCTPPGFISLKVFAIFTVICLYFSLVLVPFLGAAQNPDRNQV